MTTTAKQSSSSPSSDVRRNSPSSSIEAAEDIETIAKQISDHAEAIYQEWKARGSIEILKCHPETENNSSFNKTLTPQSPQSPSSQSSKRSFLEDSTLSSSDLLSKAPDLSNNNLKQLVNSFVNEDKARIAAQREGTPSGSGSIKYTLKKFESLQDPSTSVSNSPVLFKSNPSSPSSSTSSSTFSSSHHQNNHNNSSSSNSRDNNKTNDIESSSNLLIQYQVPDVLKDTIEKCSKRQKPETPAKPEHLLNHVPTWPFKNRLVSPNGNSIEMKTPLENKKNKKATDSASSPSSDSRPSRKSIDVMDEVSREEEKLINALKTGTVLTNDNNLPEVITSSLNEYKTQTELQLNGLTSAIKESRKHENLTRPNMIANNNNNNNNNINSNDETDMVSQNQTNNPPQKPNHTPIYVPPKEDSSKGFSSFTRVATTRIPHRDNLSKLDEKKFEFKSIPSPVRPFLSRGSVAERVLIFEKCPEKAPARTTTEKPKILVS
jgi:serine/threonine-protein phosphatase 2A regulatory subunit B''